MTKEKPNQKKSEQTKKHEAKPVENFWNKQKEIRLKKLFKKQKRKISFKKVAPGKKEKLAKQARRTRWAPVWVILKKFGPGKRIHPSAITVYKRSWRRGKLHIKPRKIKAMHYG